MIKNAESQLFGGKGKKKERKLFQKEKEKRKKKKLLNYPGSDGGKLEPDLSKFLLFAVFQVYLGGN